MSDLLSKWASELGIPVDKVQKALGGILTAMRGTLPQETYQEVAAALPDSDESVAAFESTEWRKRQASARRKGNTRAAGY